jgi:hypothetical protein
LDRTAKLGVVAVADHPPENFGAHQLSRGRLAFRPRFGRSNRQNADRDSAPVCLPNDQLDRQISHQRVDEHETGRGRFVDEDQQILRPPREREEAARGAQRGANGPAYAFVVLENQQA